MVRNLETGNKELKKGLYLVSTPIGNLEDITYRAVDILRKSDYILCEDTRNSKILLKKYDIKCKLISNHKFNEKKNLSRIIELLNNRSIISLISDAGTPSISDPGAVLVNECIKHNINIIPIPGPSSVTMAVTMSGFSDKFFFYGFFPEKKKLLINDLENLSKLNSSIVFFVSPKKFSKIIPYLKKNFSGRKILVCREMTKYYEEFLRSSIDDLDSLELKFKGEITLVISENTTNKKISPNLDESDKRLISEMINKLSIKEITNLINQGKKVSKKEIYNYCIEIKDEK
ncbi:MAG: 16S rRNA (cytidine(1402)-2'-O)-methyltransferase [Candidatus Pelagibacter sp.]